LEHLKFLIKVNNIIGYVLIATIILSPIGFIQVLLGYLVLLQVEGGMTGKEKPISK
jgi:hypothetical protein